MAEAPSTRWSLIRGAALGVEEARDEFARLYGGVVRAYFGARWRHGPFVAELDDAVQEVFLACFREHGVLTRADPARPFRGFLYGVVRNVARKTEARRRPAPEVDLDSLEGDNSAASEVFDRAFAAGLLQQAAALQMEFADDERKRRRVELLRLRFEDDLPIREIARLWRCDPAGLHHEYAAAREDYRHALREVVKAHQAGSPDSIDKECERLFAVFR